MSSNNKNTLKIFPFYKGKIMKKNKEFSNIKLLSELPFFEKPKNFTVRDSLREQLFYKAPIKKPKSKKLTNQELLQVLPFYDSVGITKKERAFRNYVSTYSVEIMDRESLMDTLDLSRTSINELFTDLLREKRGFKYFITARVTLKKRVNNGFDIRRPYFNSTIKTVINDRCFIEDPFEEIINGTDQWTSEGSGWTIDNIESFYVNIANYEHYRVVVIFHYLKN